MFGDTEENFKPLTYMYLTLIAVQGSAILLYIYSIYIEQYVSKIFFIGDETIPFLIVVINMAEDCRQAIST